MTQITLLQSYRYILHYIKYKVIISKCDIIIRFEETILELDHFLRRSEGLARYSPFTRQYRQHSITTQTRSYLHHFYYSAVATQTPVSNMTCDWQLTKQR